MIDIIIFIVFIAGVIAYCLTHNYLFFGLAALAAIIMHGLHQQEIIDTKTEMAEDVIKFFKRNDKNE